MPKIPSDPPQLSNTIRATRVIRLGGNGLMCLGVILNLIFDMTWVAPPPHQNMMK
jgi:hypothetical protein